MIFDFILHSDVQYDFKFYTALRRTVRFLILYCTSDVQYDFLFYTALGRKVRFLILYCTRAYNMIFDFILYWDVQYDF